MQPGELRRVRAINGLVTKNIYFGVPETMRKDCEITILAYDGVYLSKPRTQDDIFLPPGTFGHFCLPTGEVPPLWVPLAAFCTASLANHGCCCMDRTYLLSVAAEMLGGGGGGGPRARVHRP